MTNKSQRQRGSRTHGGGSHKNRRGAGHQGGKGAAGRDKHEFHNHEPLGKSGFVRPPDLQDTVETINLSTIDEFVFYSDSSRVDARVLASEGEDADVVKVLGGGRIQHEVEVIADEFSSSAINEIEAVGGEAVHAGEIETVEDEAACAGMMEEPKTDNKTMDPDNGDYLDTARKKVEDGESFTPGKIESVLEEGIETDRIDESYNIIVDAMGNVDQVSPEHVVKLYYLQSTAENTGIDTTELESVLDDYFGELLTNNRKEELQRGVQESLSPEDVENGLKELETEWEERLGEDYDPLDNGLEDAKKNYLLSVRCSI